MTPTLSNKSFDTRPLLLSSGLVSKETIKGAMIWTTKSACLHPIRFLLCANLAGMTAKVLLAATLNYTMDNLSQILISNHLIMDLGHKHLITLMEPVNYE